jgi:hypothetical protein
MAELDVLHFCIEAVKKDVAAVKKELKELNLRLEIYYLTIKQYEAEIKPIRNIVYGMVGLILTSVLLALVYTVITKGSL